MREAWLPRRRGKGGEQVYRETCAACHDTGAAGAPRIGDKKAWAPRIREGKRMMVKMAIRGIRGMPPRGGNPALTDEEVERAVVYLLNRSGARIRE
ncbi:MAG: c-type cytochrome [Burkholderiales bacterium]|nr:c-type cytochrome [Burkholderiales bacterium]